VARRRETVFQPEKQGEICRDVRFPALVTKLFCGPDANIAASKQ
jgi:hypothetical protein